VALGGLLPATQFCVSADERPEALTIYLLTSELSSSP
jgi:hypothetical protein